MKRIHLIFLLSILIGISFNSCNDMLKEEPETFISPDNFYKNESQCLSAVNYLYYPLTQFYKRELLFATDLTSDLSYFYGTNVDPVNFFGISPASPGTVAINGWTACYSGIMQANNTIKGIERATIEEETKQKLIGEAACLRGFYYYILTEIFNDVPFYFDEVISFADQDRIGKLPRMSAIATRDSVIDNIEQYIDYLPIKTPSDASFQRVSRQFAYMLIAKMAMKNYNYALAKQNLLKIRSIYGVLDPNVYTVEGLWFSNKNAPESIFEVQYVYDSSGIRKTSGVSYSMMPPLTTAGTDVFDGVSIPFIGTGASRSNPASPSNYLISLYDKISTELKPELNGIDLRKRITLADGYNGVQFARVKKGGKPYFGIKFWTPNMIASNDGNNQPVFRYADAILMLAECYNEGSDRDPAQSLALLQEIRVRAGYITFFTKTDKKAILKEIQEERARELVGEYQRKFDLVRWGIYYNQVKNTTGLESQTIFDNIRPYHKYLPIPDAEIIRSKGLLTNEDYQ